MTQLNPFSSVTASALANAGQQFGTPLYLYDEALIAQRCKNLLSMPNPYGLTVRYAMKANSNRSILAAIRQQGVLMDASSMNEARRANLAGIPFQDIMLTTQEVPQKEERADLEQMILAGMKYNVCSLRQLELIADFAAANSIPLSMRVHPGVGAGESASRNTGDNYSCFGVHLADIDQALALAAQKNLTFYKVHVHIGSGGDPEAWRSNIDRQLGILEQYFPQADTVSFGGGLKEARMPSETAADIQDLGSYAKQKLEEFARRTGRTLKMEIEPGTYIVANAGYIITQVIDKKRTGPSGLNFLIVDGGMEVNTRPLLYGSQHPLYAVSSGGSLLSSSFAPAQLSTGYSAAVVGRCCESGDSQTIDENGLNCARPIGEPEIGDYIVIGGAGAYCSSMSPFNYNSHVQAPEVLLEASGHMRIIRRRQTLAQVIENEL